MKISLSNVEVYLPKRESPLFRIGQFEIASGAHLLIQGPSGKGKTTLLHLIGGLHLATLGHVKVGEMDWAEMNDAQRCQLRRQKFGIIFQKLNLLDHLTARENAELALTTHKKSAVMDALKMVHMEERTNQRTAEMSLGEQQRIAVARVLAARPEVILADEPTSSLDADNAQSVMESLLKKSGNATVVVVSHDRRIAQAFSQVVEFGEMIN